MLNTILFSIIVVAIIVITIMYLKSIQINNQEVRYNIVMRFLIVGLLTIMFTENKMQTGMLSNVTNTIQTYMMDAGKTFMDFIDTRTKDINSNLSRIDERLDSINKDISSINTNIDDTRNSITDQLSQQQNNIINNIKSYFDIKTREWIESLTPLGPGGVRTIW